MSHDTNIIRQTDTAATQNITLFTPGVPPGKQEIINRAVEAKNRGDHRLAKLLAHQVICTQVHIGPHTKKLLKALITREA